MFIPYNNKNDKVKPEKANKNHRYEICAGFTIEGHIIFRKNALQNSLCISQGYEVSSQAEAV